MAYRIMSESCIALPGAMILGGASEVGLDDGAILILAELLTPIVGTGEKFGNTVEDSSKVCNISTVDVCSACARVVVAAGIIAGITAAQRTSELFCALC